MEIIISCIIMSSILWRLGGMGVKAFRKFGVPVIISISKLMLTGMDWWILVYGVVLWGMLSLFSYGLSAPPHKFWVWVFKRGGNGECWYVELITRLTCGLFWCGAGVVFAVITGHWLNFIMYLIMGTIGIGFFGLVDNDYVSELGTGAVVATCVLI